MLFVTVAEYLHKILCHVKEKGGTYIYWAILPGAYLNLYLYIWVMDMLTV